MLSSAPSSLPYSNRKVTAGLAKSLQKQHFRVFRYSRLYPREKIAFKYDLLPFAHSFLQSLTVPEGCKAAMSHTVEMDSLIGSSNEGSGALFQQTDL